MGHALGASTWPELSARRPFIALPLGSCEQHGPHLPLDTDTRIAIELAHRLAAARPDVLVAPPLTIGASWEHAGFPGLLSITNELLASCLIEIARSADWSGGLVFVNGHGGNVGGVAAATERICAEGRLAVAWSPHVNGGDAHAGRTETSMLLAIDPQAVRVDRVAPGFTGRPSGAFAGPLRASSPTGVLGDPRPASADEGRELLEQLTADLVHTFDGWQTAIGPR